MRFRRSVAGPMEEACSPMTWREVGRRTLKLEGANARAGEVERERLIASVASEFARRQFLVMIGVVGRIRQVD